MPLRRLDPRLNPLVRPHEWSAAARRTRLKLLLAIAGVLAAGLLGAAIYLYYPLDRTEGLAPEAVVRAAGEAILSADRYGFTVNLTGKSQDNFFPTATMRGEYQREPLLMHLQGSAQSGENTVPLEYYLSGKDLYLRDPRDEGWMLLPDANLEELHSFQPDNLAAPLLHGVRSAVVTGRDKLPEGEALVIRLDLDPLIMTPRLKSAQADPVEYRLWVYTRSLKPARFTIEMRTVRHEAADYSFAYALSWDFDRAGALRLPDEVQQSAKPLNGTPPNQQLPPAIGR